MSVAPTASASLAADIIRSVTLGHIVYYFTRSGEEEIKLLRKEGMLKPIYEGDAKKEFSLPLTANATYLIEIK